MKIHFVTKKVDFFYFFVFSTSIKSEKSLIISCKSDDLIKKIQKSQDSTTKSLHVFNLNLFLTFLGITICHFDQTLAVHSIFSIVFK